MEFPYLTFDEARSGDLVSLQAAVQPILGNNLLPHFTDHSVTHSDRLVALLGKLLRPIQETKHQLQSDELFVLYSACYLHDLGMQYENVAHLGVIPPAEMPQPWADLELETKQQLLRHYHNRISAELVRASGSPSFPIHLPSFAPNNRSAISCLCEAHCIDMESDCGRYEELVDDRPGIRMSFLSGLLRVADILDESQNRTVWARHESLTLTPEEDMHWWRLHYTEVDVNPAENRVTLCFDFPPSRASEYEKVVPELQVPRIKDEFSRHQRVFAANGLAWAVSDRVVSRPYSAAKEMPDAVLTCMLKDLQQRATRQKEEQRTADLKAFAAAQPLFRRQRDQLERERGETPPADYLRKLRRLARDRWQHGGKTAAIAMLLDAFRRDANTLPDVERVETAIELATWMREAQDTWRAKSVLQVGEAVADNLPERADLLRQFWELAAECLNDETEYENSEASVGIAISLSGKNEVREALELKKMEWRFLRGVLPKADQGIADRKPDAATVDSGVESPSTTTRKTIICALSLAMQGDAKSACECVHNALSIPPEPLDKALLLQAEALLYYLDGKAREALAVLDEGVPPNQEQIPPEWALRLAENRGMILMAHPRLDDDWHSRLDEKRLRGMETLDGRAVWEGISYAHEGRHSSAIAIFWRQLCGAWQTFDWQGQLWARELLGEEYLRSQHYKESAWHALWSRNEKLAKEIGAALRDLRDVALIGSLIDWLIPISCLRSHARIACLIIKEFIDELPDDRVDKVFSWLMRFAEDAHGDTTFPSRFSAVWSAIGALVPRLKEADRCSAARTAIKHPAWGQPVPPLNVIRKHLITAVWKAVRIGLPHDITSEVTHSAIPLATTEKFDFDYEEAIELLIALYRQDHENRELIVSSLYQGGKATALLAQAASHFDIKVTPERLVESARRAADKVRLQVQRLSVDGKPTPAGIMEITTQHGQQKTVVSEGAGVRELNIIIAHRKQLPDSALREVIQATLEVLQDPDNSVGNCSSLLEILACLTDTLQEDVLDRMIGVALPIARGERTFPTFSEDDPLSRFRFEDVGTGYLRGTAVYLLTTCGSQDCGRLGQEIIPILNRSLVDSDREVRFWSYRALRQLSSLPSPMLAAVLIGTQDVDSNVAREAWKVLAKLSIETEDAGWYSLLFALEKALAHQDAGVRGAAARAAKNLEKHVPAGPLREKTVTIKVSFAADVSYSVRAVARDA